MMTRYFEEIDQAFRMSYLDEGQGETLLFIHGFTGTALSHLSGLITQFRENYRVIAPDLRGYGASRPPNRDYPPDFYERDAADLAVLLTKLKCEPVIVLGFSDGAETALLLAATHPELVRGVVAWGVSGVISPEELEKVEGWLPVSAWGPENQAWKEDIIQRQGAEQLEPMITGWVSAARAIAAKGGNISFQQAANITCPVLLLNGDGEVGNTLRDVQALAARIPDCQLEIIPGSGHGIQWDQPEILTDRIGQLLTTLQPQEPY